MYRNIHVPKRVTYDSNEGFLIHLGTSFFVLCMKYYFTGAGDAYSLGNNG